MFGPQCVSPCVLEGIKSNLKSRREIHHHRKPSGNRLFFKFQKSEEVDSGGDLVVVGGKGKKQHKV